MNCLIREHGPTPLKLGLVEVSDRTNPHRDSPSQQPLPNQQQEVTLHDEKTCHGCEPERPVSFFLCSKSSARPATNRRNAMRRAEANAEWGALDFEQEL